MTITIEEAIKMLKQFAIVDAIQEDYDVIDMAIEALEKQIPKKPNGDRCPVCNANILNWVDEGDDFEYCPDCGQKIDWSEDE